MWEVWGWRLFGLFFGVICALELLNVVVWRVHGGLGIYGMTAGGLLAWWCFRMAQRAKSDITSQSL
jgi:hypothetical protein